MADTFNKRLNTSDVFTIPYEANKLWNLNSSSFSDYNINFELGIFPTQSNKRDYNRYNLIYKLILANYYPEFYPSQSHSTSSYFQTNNLRSDLSTASYSNGLLRLGNLKTTEKYFPTSTGSFIYVINIPKSLYSEKIIPTTFELEFNGGKLYDDGEYNLRYSGSNQTSSIGTILSQSSYVGNLFYEQGLGVLTVIPESVYSNDSPYEWVVIWFENFANDPGYTNNWQSHYTYTDSYGTQTLSFFNLGSVGGYFCGLVRQVKGSGTFTTISGTPIPSYTQILPTNGNVSSYFNIVWEVQAGAEQVSSYDTSFDLVPYTNPPSTNPSLPSSLPVDTELIGVAAQGMTYNKGIRYLRIN
jgi:hypothetical protein